MILYGKYLSQLGKDGLAEVRQRCGYVQQDPYGAIPPGLTALEAVCEPAVIAGVRTGREEIRACLQNLALRERGYWVPGRQAFPEDRGKGFR